VRKLEQQSPMTITAQNMADPVNTQHAHQAAAQLRDRVGALMNSGLDDTRQQQYSARRLGLGRGGRTRQRITSFGNKTGEKINSTTFARIEPSPEQRVVLSVVEGHSRYIYNTVLGDMVKNNREAKPKALLQHYEPMVTEERVADPSGLFFGRNFIVDLPSQLRQRAVKTAIDAYVSAFRYVLPVRCVALRLRRPRPSNAVCAVMYDVCAGRWRSRASRRRRRVSTSWRSAARAPSPCRTPSTCCRSM